MRSCSFGPFGYWFLTPFPRRRLTVGERFFIFQPPLCNIALLHPHIPLESTAFDSVNASVVAGNPVAARAQQVR